MNDRFGYRIAPASGTHDDKGPELPDYLKSKRTLVSEPFEGTKVKKNASASANKERYVYAASSASSRASGNSRGGGGGSGRGTSASPRRPRRRNNRAKTMLIAAVSLLCVMLGVLVFVFLSAPPVKPAPGNDPREAMEPGITDDSGKFFEGVKVDGMDVGGLTYTQAQSKVAAVAEEKLNSIGYSLVLGENEFTITRDDMGASVDYDTVLKQAFQAGREGSILQNIDEQNRIKSEGAAFNTEMVFDDTVLRARLEKLADEAYIEPVEPHAVVNKESEDRFTYESGKDGKKVDVEALINDIDGRLKSGELSASINMPTIAMPPKHTIEEVKSNLKKITSFTTSFNKSSSSRDPKRVANIQKASDIISGAELTPGQEWSFNEFVGPRTEKGGWSLAPGIVNGNMYEMQAGGGICQVSTTLYNAWLKANLKVASSRRHSWPSAYVEYGLDATVSTGGPDLVLTNNTDYSVFIFSSVNTKDKTMTVSVYGPDTLGEGVEIKLHSKVLEEKAPPEPEEIEDPLQPTGYKETVIQARSGYKCEVYRDFIQNGKTIKTETLYSHSYRSVKGVIRIGTGPEQELPPVPQQESNPASTPAQPTPTPAPEQQMQGGDIARQIESLFN